MFIQQPNVLLLLPVSSDLYSQCCPARTLNSKYPSCTSLHQIASPLPASQWHSLNCIFSVPLAVTLNVANEDLKEKTNSLFYPTLHSCLAKYEYHTLNALFAHPLRIFSYLLHYSSNPVVISIAFRFLFCSIQFSLLLPGISLPMRLHTTYMSARVTHTTLVVV